MTSREEHGPIHSNTHAEKALPKRTHTYTILFAHGVATFGHPHPHTSAARPRLPPDPPPGDTNGVDGDAGVVASGPRTDDGNDREARMRDRGDPRSGGRDSASSEGARTRTRGRAETSPTTSSGGTAAVSGTPGHESRSARACHATGGGRGDGGGDGGAAGRGVTRARLRRGEGVPGGAAAGVGRGAPNSEAGKFVMAWWGRRGSVIKE